MKDVLLVLGAIVSVVLIFTFTIFGFENRAITLEESVNNQKSVIETQEKARYDLIPNLVECVKKYSEHEAKTLENVASIRSGNTISDSKMKEIHDAINVVVERYPELKADRLFTDLMQQLTICENTIANARNSYNLAVTEYKKYTKKFPNRIFLSFTGYDVLDFERLVFENNSIDAPKLNF